MLGHCSVLSMETNKKTHVLLSWGLHSEAREPPRQTHNPMKHRDIQAPEDFIIQWNSLKRA